MALANQSTFLAQDIPARTFAVGANELVANDLGPIVRENFDMRSQFQSHGWPIERVESAKNAKWLHSDIHVIPFQYTGAAITKWVQLGDE
jgi:hypothetical protein